MGRGVFGCLPLVVTTCYYFAVKNDDGSDWDITYLGRCSSFVKCKTHPGVQIVLSYGCSHMVTIRGPVEREGTRPRAWRPGDLRHSRDSAESCCLPALTRFTGSGRTGPDRHTPERVPDNDTAVARIASWGTSRPSVSRRRARYPWRPDPGPLGRILEGCESGRFGTPGTRVWLYGHRGFESHSLRRTDTTTPPVGVAGPL